MIFIKNTSIYLFATILAVTIPNTAYAQNAGVKTTVSTVKFKGLQVGRTNLISSLGIIDSLLHFKEIPVTKGLPKLAAKGSFGSRIEITGTEDNVTKAQYTVSQPATGTLNKLAFTRMAFFVNVLGKQEAAAWFFQQINNYNQSPTLSVNNLFVIEGGNLVFNYNPVKKVFTMTASSL